MAFYSHDGDVLLCTATEEVTATDLDKVIRRSQSIDPGLTANGVWHSMAGYRFVPAPPRLPVFVSDDVRTEHVVCLPVPEKAQATYNFCVFPKYGDGAPSLPEGRPLHEAMVWTVPDVKAKDVGDEKPNYRKSMTEAVEATGMRVLEPDALEFASEVQQAYRKGEKAYHVKAFRGSKDGKPSKSSTHDVEKNRSHYSHRISLFPTYRHRMGLQKAPPLLLPPPHLLDILHLRPPTHLQPQHRRPIHRRPGVTPRLRILHDRSGRLRRHRCVREKAPVAGRKHGGGEEGKEVEHQRREGSES